MGNKQVSVPIEGRGHPRHFDEGIDALNEGRYSIAEIKFQQCFKKHPGRPFWNKLMHTAFFDEEEERGTSNEEEDIRRREKDKIHSESIKSGNRKKSDAQAMASIANAAAAVRRKSSIAAMEGSQIGNDDDEAAAREAGFDFGDDHNGRDGANNAGPGSNFTKPKRRRTVVLPTDRRLTDIVNFVRMAADIAMAYLELRADHKNRNIAFLYCEFICMHTQVLLHYLDEHKKLQKARSARKRSDSLRRRSRALSLHSAMLPSPSDSVDSQGRTPVERGWEVEDPNYSDMDSDDAYNKKGAFDGPEDPVEIVLMLLEQQMRYYWVSFTSLYTTLTLECAMGIDLSEHNESKRRARKKIFTNCIEACNSVRTHILKCAAVSPENYVNQIFLEGMPRNMWEFMLDEDYGMDMDELGNNLNNNNNNNKKKSEGSSGMNTYNRNFYITISDKTEPAQQTFLHLAKSIKPTISPIVPVKQLKPMQLVINKSQHDAQGNKLRPAKIRTPAERLSYYYAGFLASDLLCILPGNTSSILKNSLEHYTETLPVAVTEVITNMRQRDIDEDEDYDTENDASSVLNDGSNGFGNMNDNNDDSRLTQSRRRSTSGMNSRKGSFAASRRSSIASNMRDAESDYFANENFDRMDSDAIRQARLKGKQAHGYEIIRRQVERAMCPQPNPNLDLHNERTLITLCAEENFLIFLTMVVLGAAVKNLMHGGGGNEDNNDNLKDNNADGTVNVNMPISGYTLLTITETLYGPDSLLHQLFKREVLSIDSEDGAARWSRPSLYLRGAWTSRM